MAYLDIIPLADAKIYLRIDDDLTEDDAQITRMINVSLSYVERYTNVILFAKEKTYRLIDGCISVYDFKFQITHYGLIYPESIDKQVNPRLELNIWDDKFP